MFVRTKDGITTSNKATHELIEHICCAGYLRTLEKGAYVRIDKVWFNLYGKWVDIIDENGVHYSIRPDEVERVTKKLPYADTIEELCDKFVYIKHIDDKTFHYFYNSINTTNNELYDSEGILHYKHRKELEIYGAIWTDKGLIYVAKMNEKGELELL